MPLLTFDNAASLEPSDHIDDFDGEIPDEIDCGENNKFWVKCLRQKKVMVLIDKVTGQTLHTVEIRQKAFSRIAASFGVGPRQIGAVKAALRLNNVNPHDATH